MLEAIRLIAARARRPRAAHRLRRRAVHAGVLPDRRRPLAQLRQDQGADVRRPRGVAPALRQARRPWSRDYLRAQIEAGAQAVQIFDSWVGALVAPRTTASSRCRTPQSIFDGARTARTCRRSTSAPAPRRSSPTCATAGGDVIGVDWRMPIDDAWDQLGHDRAVQGNLDPTLLLGPHRRACFAGADDVLERAAGRPGPHLQPRPRHPAGDAARARAGARARSCTGSAPPDERSGGRRRRAPRRRRRRGRRRPRRPHPGARRPSTRADGAGARSRLPRRRRHPIPSTSTACSSRRARTRMLVQKPAAIALCRELGLGRRTSSRPKRRGRRSSSPTASCTRFPPDTGLGLPLTRAAAEGLTMLSAAERARVARDFDDPAPPAETEDESVGAFTTRRFGEAFTRRVAQPLLGGIHAGDVDRLSLRALFPPLADADAGGGSILAALAARAGAPDGDGAFRGLRGGMGQLPAALARALPGAALRTVEPVASGRARATLPGDDRERARGRGTRRGARRPGGGRGSTRGALRCGARLRLRRAPQCIERDGHARLPARSRRAPVSRHGLHRAARRGDPPARRVVGVVEMGGARAVRLGRHARVRRRRLRCGRARGERRRAGRADARRPGGDPRHQWPARARPPASLARRQPAVRGRPSRSCRAHRPAGSLDAGPVPDRQRATAASVCRT